MSGLVNPPAAEGAAAEAGAASRENGGSSRPAAAADAYTAVRRRVFRQLIESVLYEGIVAADKEQADSSDSTLFRLHGFTAGAEPVVYECRGRITSSFGRIRLDHTPVLRRAGQSVKEAESLAAFVEEVLGRTEADSLKLSAFAGEVEQTLLHDTVAYEERISRGLRLGELDYDALESGALNDGHPYHPAYKSRIGFDPADNRAFGPEFRTSITLMWAAVRLADAVAVIDSEAGSLEELWRQELGEIVLQQFRHRLMEEGCDPAAYVLLPIHPWQWREHISRLFLAEIRSGRIIPLGEAGSSYLPQQSIRTLANRIDAGKPYVKLSLNLINTSSSRQLLPLFVENAPVVTRWLKRAAAQDRYLTEEARLILLGEFAGVSYAAPDQAAAGLLAAQKRGALGCIWRESLSAYLQEGETAVPFTALCAMEADGRPYISSWLSEYGVDQWVEQLMEACVLPVVHLAVVQGIALEAHAQNMVLVHRDGRPVRAALKDFHEDVLFYRPGLLHPELCPPFTEDTGFEAERIEQIRYLTLGALFFINLSELALLLAEQLGYEEGRFWDIAAGSLLQHMERFPEYADRFQAVNLFAETTRVEQLTKRRLYPEGLSLMHEVPNPLYAAARRRGIHADRRTGAYRKAGV
ncbi:siderophore biosynthesis protein [Paenibacillus sambharensis]|uniref:Siderophore biosynthesis protein n=1 Tax=Paenibacillus sambharensis TaxID=1803190 RepID=A0A2W1LUE0_9BACL|nr:IucA/IucC family protein [Paenibacillus sambharensis]PZD95401.1 siderophore biosynthesis protein [Paenibacillus sambharensis]